ncbi:MAG: 3-oxoacyl-[acyl-carrier-protein] reductase FabG [Alphaproteobacteria bacterium MarineAlpha11_Bin1]|nr:MAG: 3-oxoacyl-[acyl-carrier-protein] reductase FabG [Alphaproteobacteria bacterium MarineAlpha11_Bin1]|tara:strand:- start:20058 stop:20846 length:789 start_codon:yes stop_codon:yes gene_type:complete
MEISLDGRTALITGGSEGLGKGMAIRFAQSGADIAIIARRPDVLTTAKAEVEAAGKGKVIAITCDLLSSEETAKAFSDVEEAFGKIDILVNNAGTSRAKPFETVTDNDWDEDIQLKLMAAVRLCRSALPGMKQRKWGRIINVLNIGAKAPTASGAPTVVSRAAGLALTKVLASEGAPHNVLVNALMVGLIKSAQWERAFEKEKDALDYEVFVQRIANKRNIPLGRIGETDEFANIACFLASDQAGYITGTSINVDGGASPVI